MEIIWIASAVMKLVNITQLRFVFKNCTVVQSVLDFHQFSPISPKTKTGIDDALGRVSHHVVRTKTVVDKNPKVGEKC